MFLAVALFGVANPVFALSSLFWLSPALLVAGAADMVSVFIRSALVQFSTPDNMRGRVNAVNMLFIGSSNELGEFRAGTSASLVGAIPAAILGGVCTLGVVGAWMTGFKSLRQSTDLPTPRRRKNRRRDLLDKPRPSPRNRPDRSRTDENRTRAIRAEPNGPSHLYTVAFCTTLLGSPHWPDLYQQRYLLQDTKRDPTCSGKKADVATT